MSRIVIAPLLLIGSALGGCVAMTGAPQPVGKLKTVAAWPPHLDDAIEAYRAETDDTLRKSKRNAFVAKYMAAADDQYDAFVANLSKEMRGTNIAADIGVLALSGLGAVTTGAANELAAGTAFLTGSRATVNKELYLERALPAILTSMDANRLRVAGRIAANRRLADSEYSLDDALLDLRDYERAGNINRAFNQLAEAARAAFVEAQQDFPNAKDACVAPATLTPLRGAITRYLNTLQGQVALAMPSAGSSGDQALGRVAAAMAKYGLKPVAKAASPADLAAQRAAIRDQLLASCSLDEARQLQADITGGNDG